MNAATRVIRKWKGAWKTGERGKRRADAAPGWVMNGRTRGQHALRENSAQRKLNLAASCTGRFAGRYHERRFRQVHRADRMSARCACDCRCFDGVVACEVDFLAKKLDGSEWPGWRLDWPGRGVECRRVALPREQAGHLQRKSPLMGEGSSLREPVHHGDPRGRRCACANPARHEQPKRPGGNGGAAKHGAGTWQPARRRQDFGLPPCREIPASDPGPRWADADGLNAGCPPPRSGGAVRRRPRSRW